ncbi:MAG: SDR family NAD(P)-dependent oxidoreductase [Nevskiaceae bacterium]|nr:MAG: SDR family NAD(P)-dependent oxidoreductase [Nevskiaceae bacterium]TBR73015.1 MAG: SDR family NAD(P)-dependent oxidoreductase [Nevskiaceae bacterium]
MAVNEGLPASGVALVIGAGDGNGAAIARRFARGGYTVCVVRRDAEKLQPLVAQITAEGGRAFAYATDATVEAEVATLVEQVEREHGGIEVLVFNVGVNRPQSILDETADGYRKLWELGCLAGFLAGREVAGRMVARGHGTILFTGATASLRGAARFAAFAGAKHGLRALAQSMARELGPRGIHVAHVVIDGLIDTVAVKTVFPAYYAQCEKQGRLIAPEHVAENYWALHIQPRDTWSFELDLRPAVEPW